QEGEVTEVLHRGRVHRGVTDRAGLVVGFDVGAAAPARILRWQGGVLNDGFAGRQRLPRLRAVALVVAAELLKLFGVDGAVVAPLRDFLQGEVQGLEQVVAVRLRAGAARGHERGPPSTKGVRESFEDGATCSLPY